VPRPYCRRIVEASPAAAVFKPAGVPLPDLPVIDMTLDELEAVRLADLEGLYQEGAAARMHVSRTTFARIVEAARRKIAEALVLGSALRIEGGPVIPRPRRGHCGRCACRPPAPAAASGPSRRDQPVMEESHESVLPGRP